MLPMKTLVSTLSGITICAEKAPPPSKADFMGGTENGSGGSLGKGAPKAKGKKSEMTEGGKPKKEKKPKDPNAPKKNLTGFMYFSSSNREKVKSENPGKPCYGGLSCL